MQTQQTMDYSIHSLIIYLWSKKMWIIGIPFVVTLITAGWSLTISNTYLSDTVLSPTEEASGGGLANLSGQLGGLASLAGISLGESSTDHVTIAMAILESRQFISRFVNKYELKDEIMAAQEWDEVTGELIFDVNIYDPASQTWTRKPEGNRPSEPTDLEVYEKFRELLIVERDKATNLVTISIEFFSPDMAQIWLQNMIAEVNNVMREREIDTTQQNIAYLEEQVEGLDNIEMRTVFFQLIQEQSKNLMLAEVRTDFVFTIIDPPILPELKHAPRRALICIVAMILSGFLVVAGFTLSFLIVPRNH